MKITIETEESNLPIDVLNFPVTPAPGDEIVVAIGDASAMHLIVQRTIFYSDGAITVVTRPKGRGETHW